MKDEEKPATEGEQADKPADQEMDGGANEASGQTNDQK